MKPRRVPSSNFVFRLSGGTEDNDLWVRREPYDGHPTLSSVWVPTDEERAAIAAGENIELTTWGEGTPPLAMRTTPEQPGATAPALQPLTGGVLGLVEKEMAAVLKIARGVFERVGVDIRGLVVNVAWRHGETDYVAGSNAAGQPPMLVEPLRASIEEIEG